jgi:hypothetical protein
MKHLIIESPAGIKNGSIRLKRGLFGSLKQREGLFKVKNKAKKQSKTQSYLYLYI